MSAIVVIEKSELEDTLRSIISELYNPEVQEEKSNSELPEYLTRKETSRFLGISLSKLDQLHNEGLLIKYRNGSIVRYPKVSVLEFYKSFTKYSRSL